MKNLIFIYLLCIGYLEAGTIQGDVFIVTKGQDVKKLALTTVNLYERGKFQPFIEKKIKDGNEVNEYFEPLKKLAYEGWKTALNIESKASRTRFDDYSNLEKENSLKKAKEDSERMKANVDRSDGFYTYPKTGFWFFDSERPSPLQSAKTGADAGFQFQVPDGKYVLTAMNSRSAGSDTEFYFWIVGVDVAGDTTVHLSNDNLSTSNSKDSLITTREHTDDAIMSMKDHDSEWLLEFVRLKKKEDADKEKLNAETKRAEELAHYTKNPSLALKRAVEIYPALSDKTSSLNVEFVARRKRYQTENPGFLKESDWPIRLAKECSDALEKE